MRVAHVLRKYNPAEWGGTETALQRAFEALTPQGVESIVYAPRCESNGAHDPFQATGCTVRRFRACVPIWGVPRSEKAQMIAVGGNLLSFDLLPMLLRDRELNLIHSHALGRLGGIALTAAKRRRVPFVVTIHGGVLAIPNALRESFENGRSTGIEWGRLFGAFLNSRRVLTDADAILTCNEEEAELLREKYPGKRIAIQPHGVPLRIFEADRRSAALNAWPLLNGREVLLIPGRIDPVKNQAWVLEQSGHIAATHPRALIVIAGPCTDKEYGLRVDQLATRRNLAGHVLLTGALPPGDPRLIGLFQLANAVVLPSISETFGLIVLEAWAACAPVIASRTPGASALVRHRENGWLFDLKSPGAFREAVDSALRRPDLAHVLATRGRELVAREYDSYVLATRLKDLYQELIERKQTANRPARFAEELVHQ